MQPAKVWSLLAELSQRESHGGGIAGGAVPAAFSPAGLNQSAE